MRHLIFAIIPLLTLGFFSANAEEAIPITFSGTIDKVVFDGKWSFEYEWKQSSLNEYKYEDGNKLIILRSAHQGEFIYIFLDVINDESNNSSDKAVICFDTNNDKTTVDDNDYCFMAVLNGGMGVSYQGNSSTNEFIKIDNHPDFVGISGISDENDRYSGIPHLGYEFKIPTQVIQRNNVYGFYFGVYDGTTDKLYTYPTNIETTEMMVGPSYWGEIYSPDKSLPEFYLPFLVTIPAFVLVIMLTRIRKIF